MASETKTDSSFPNMQFHLDSFSIYKLDSSECGGGTLVYVWEEIPSSIGWKGSSKN